MHWGRDMQALELGSYRWAGWITQWLQDWAAFPIERRDLPLDSGLVFERIDHGGDKVVVVLARPQETL